MAVPRTLAPRTETATMHDADPDPDPRPAGPDLDFDRFCRTMAPRLAGSLVLQLGDRGRAEDVAQEALARAWLRWSEVGAMANPAGWVYTVAFNLAMSARRREASERRANRRSLGGDAGAGPEVADRMALDAALRGMPNRQRAAVALRYYAGLSVAETADVLGCAEGTVKSLTHQAIQRLRSLLDVDDETDERAGTLGTRGSEIRSADATDASHDGAGDGDRAGNGDDGSSGRTRHRPDRRFGHRHDRHDRSDSTKGDGR